MGGKMILRLVEIALAAAVLVYIYEQVSRRVSAPPGNSPDTGPPAKGALTNQQADAYGVPHGSTVTDTAPPGQQLQHRPQGGTGGLGDAANVIWNLGQSAWNGTDPNIVAPPGSNAASLGSAYNADVWPWEPGGALYNAWKWLTGNVTVTSGGDGGGQPNTPTEAPGGTTRYRAE